MKAHVINAMCVNALAHSLSWSATHQLLYESTAASKEIGFAFHCIHLAAHTFSSHVSGQLMHRFAVLQIF